MPYVLRDKYIRHVLFLCTHFHYSMPKTRSRPLVQNRNHRIIVRYYYWREIQRRRSDDVIQILSEDEFYLDPITIQRIIRKNLDKFFELKKEKPPLKKLQLYSWAI